MADAAVTDVRQCDGRHLARLHRADPAPRAARAELRAGQKGGTHCFLKSAFGGDEDLICLDVLIRAPFRAPIPGHISIRAGGDVRWEYVHAGGQRR